MRPFSFVHSAHDLVVRTRAPNRHRRRMSRKVQNWPKMAIASRVMPAAQTPKKMKAMSMVMTIPMRR